MPTESAAAEDQWQNMTAAPISASQQYAAYRILVVDDNAVNCQVAVNMLMKLGCQADAVMTGHDAVDMHKRQKYDLILLDCHMPGLDGCQTAEQIRSVESGNQRTAIVGWTSVLQAQEKEKYIAAGMDDVFGKPLRPEMVREMMTRWFHPTMLSLKSISDATENSLENTQKRFGAHYAELAALFRRDTLLRLYAMRKAAIERDNTKIAAVAHILGGSCASIGATRLSGMCRELEECCKTEFPDNINILLDDIEDQFRKADLRMTTLLQSATL